MKPLWKQLVNLLLLTIKQPPKFDAYSLICATLAGANPLNHVAEALL